MKQLTTQRRIAAQVLKAGTGKIWFDPEKLSDIREAITKSDIRSLIRVKAIRIKKIPHQSKARTRKLKLQKRKGNRKGEGSRKGRKTARAPKKKAWMTKIRGQRGFLRQLKQKQMINNKDYTDLMAKARGGFFRNKRHIKLYIQERNILKKNEKKTS